MKTQKALLGAALVALLALGGCGVAHTAIHEGAEFNQANLTQVHAGMTQGQVISLLGNPYAWGTDLDGNLYFEYHYVTTSSTAIQGGVIVAGMTGSMHSTGGDGKVTFDAGTRLVKKVTYDIQGFDNYNRLAGRKG
jgi:outer membrane protein assembly factor BamE (lipoprotein component of BamABCDE complex)